MVGIEILNKTQYINICRKISNPKNLYKDLHQETIITFIQKEYPITEIDNRNELHIFFYRVAWLTFHSGGFKKTYINHNHYTDWVDFPEEKYSYITEDEEKAQEIIEDREKKHLSLEMQTVVPVNEDEKYSQNLLALYLKLGSDYQISRVTGVPRTTIRYDLDKIKRNIKSTHEAISKG